MADKKIKKQTKKISKEGEFEDQKNPSKTTLFKSSRIPFNNKTLSIAE